MIAAPFVFPRSLRAALQATIAIPFSLLATVTGMVQDGVSGNLMSLGPLDFGIVADGELVTLEEHCIGPVGLPRINQSHGWAPGPRVAARHSKRQMRYCCNRDRPGRVLIGSTVVISTRTGGAMTNMMQGCSGWLMAAGGIVTYGTLILVAAASIKFLAFGKPSAP
jgi:hypothetical protein